jgi:hypothetical protein
MPPANFDMHERAIRDQFSRQAVGFAAALELHADDIVSLVIHAAKPQPEDKAIDLACGPGTVAARWHGASGMSSALTQPCPCSNRRARRPSGASRAARGHWRAG